MDLDSETAPSEDAKPPPTKFVSNQDWEKYRDVIRGLYNRMPLKDVRTYMAERYNFIATARMYKTRLHQWGIGKYVKGRDMQDLVRRYSQAYDGTVPMQYEVDGKIVPRSKVARYARRQGRDLSRERSGSAPSPGDTSASRINSLSSDWQVLSISGTDIIETRSDGPASPDQGDLVHVVSPAPSNQFSSSPTIIPRPFCQAPTQTSMAESPWPVTFGQTYPQYGLTQGFGHNVGQVCPPAPRLQTRQPQAHMPKDIFQQGLLLSMVISNMVKHIPLGDLSNVRLDALEQHATFDTSVLSTIMDILWWLQLDEMVVLLTVIYLIRFNRSETFPKFHNVWQQLLIALKFAQSYLHDDPYSPTTWIKAIPHLANNSLGQSSLEIDILLDPQIHLHVRKNEWKLLKAQFDHLSTSLLVWFDQGTFTSDTTRQRVGNTMDLYH